MRDELDALMQARELDAIVVSGRVRGNSPLYYLTNGAALTKAHYIKRCSEEPVLIAAAMEREEAQQAGLPVIVSTRYGYRELLQEHEGDTLATEVAYMQRILEDRGIRGHVGFYGQRDQGEAYVFLRALNEALPHVNVVGELSGSDLIMEARATKSPAEVERIREVGQRTTAIVSETVNFLKHHQVGDDELLRRDDGSVLTVGDVHAFISRQIALQGLSDPEGFIFATGRDAGIPHSKGTRTKPMRLGESIVFDIFPCEAGGGYFFDMTRTFCLGYAPQAVQHIHAETQACIEMILDALAAGEETRRYQRKACDFYAARDHPTIADDPSTVQGYVHGLGHGVGLDIHERPSFRDSPENTTTLHPGHLFTIEPGLYYPDEGMGCRLEDVVWLDNQGQPHNLTNYPYDLVVPME